MDKNSVKEEQLQKLYDYDQTMLNTVLTIDKIYNEGYSEEIVKKIEGSYRNLESIIADRDFILFEEVK